MTKEATPQGVSKRDRDYEDLLNAREQEKAGEEPKVEPELEPEGEPEIKPEGEPETKAEPEMVTFTDDDGNEYQIPKGSKAKLKIDGEEVETPVGTAFSRYQKGAAGDKRLQEASRIRQQLEAKEQQLTQKGEELSAKEQQFLEKMNQASQAHKEGDLSGDDHSKYVDELTDALIEADSDKAKELLTPLFQKDDSNMVEEKINQRFQEQERKEQEKTQREFQDKLLDARAWFEDQYPDLHGDEMLFKMTDQETAELLQKNPGVEPKEIIKQAAEKVRAWRGKPTKTKKNSAPTPASGRAKIGTDEKPQTREDILNQQRKARGQTLV